MATPGGCHPSPGPPVGDAEGSALAPLRWIPASVSSRPALCGPSQLALVDGWAHCCRAMPRIESAASPPLAASRRPCLSCPSPSSPCPPKSSASSSSSPSPSTSSSSSSMSSLPPSGCTPALPLAPWLRRPEARPGRRLLRLTLAVAPAAAAPSPPRRTTAPAESPDLRPAARRLPERGEVSLSAARPEALDATSPCEALDAPLPDPPSWLRRAESPTASNVKAGSSALGIQPASTILGGAVLAASGTAQAGATTSSAPGRPAGSSGTAVSPPAMGGWEAESDAQRAEVLAHSAGASRAAGPAASGRTTAPRTMQRRPVPQPPPTPNKTRAAATADATVARFPAELWAARTGPLSCDVAASTAASRMRFAPRASTPEEGGADTARARPLATSGRVGAGPGGTTPSPAVAARASRHTTRATEGDGGGPDGIRLWPGVRPAVPTVAAEAGLDRRGGAA
mmetsp:Transcript_2346/g.9180  ORF Transcript_2346/g.9180 Transcript_2346/m.9180 type:complete len:456 (+) Transcript_2346:2104-3471(+)